MSIDQRTRLRRDLRTLSSEEVFASVFPDAIERNGALLARGMRSCGLPALGLEVGERAFTLREQDGCLAFDAGTEHAPAIAVLDENAVSDLVQDQRTTMGLAMNAAVKMTRGALGDWVGWEPAFRALFDARPLHEAGDVVMCERDGSPLDVTRSFALDDDHEEISHFLHQAGFFHVHDVFSDREMAAVSADLDAAVARAERDDGASWWATDASGVDHAVRILWFHEQSEALRRLLGDQRLQWICELSGDGHDGSKLGAEGLVKPLAIEKGLSDLPWHKDCSQGGHSYMCSGLTVGISVTGAGRGSGALGVVPGTHRASIQPAGLHPSLDLEPLLLETKTGDITAHCSCTLHRSHRPTEQTRKVVYTSFGLPPKPGDVAPKVSREEQRSARARLASAQDRIDASSNAGTRR